MADRIDPDILVTRVIDGRDTAADWQSLEAAAGADPEVWRTLALAQRDHRALVRQVRLETAVAEHVSAPAHAMRAARHEARLDSQLDSHLDSQLDSHRREMAHRTRRVSAWAGWAAAAAMVVAFVGRMGANVDPSDANSAARSVLGPAAAGSTASLEQPLGDAAAALQSYLNKGRQDGRVIGEQPMRLLGFEQLADGAGYRVVYERPIVESAVVSVPYIVTADDLSNQGQVQLRELQPRRATRRPTIH